MSAPGLPTLSVFFFSSADTGTGPDRYRFVLETARLADRLGFEAVWVPERHFHRFGGLFPNPAVLAAALAGVTERIALRAGSVVLPLHDVARVAEEWAMVDALSGGRAGISLASGWNRGDFVLGRCDFEDRRDRLVAGIDQLRSLWRGEELTSGDTAYRTYPAPVRQDLPLWLTATSSPGTFAEAGRRGLAVLTAFLQQDRPTLERNVETYRDLFARSGSGRRPHVTVMLHAYAAATTRAALADVHRPLLDYQRDFLDLADRTTATGADGLTEDEKEALARWSVAKYARDRGLVGSDEEVRRRLGELAAAGVDEVACLVDFGLPPPLVTASLHRLAAVRSGATPVGTG